MVSLCRPAGDLCTAHGDCCEPLTHGCLQINGEPICAALIH
jgi:hypothetical protein